MSLEYHQSARSKNDSRLSKLKKVEEKYIYDGMEFPASYEAISAFEDINRVCIFIYELDSEDKIRLGQRGNIAYLTTDLIYLLRLDTDSKSHYIYIKSIDHFQIYTRILTIRSIDFAQSVQRRSCSTSSDHSLASSTTFDTNSTLIKLPSPYNAKMQFKSHKNKLRRPYIIYADTECSLEPTGLEK